MSDSVHAHMLLHELNLHCWELIGDLPMFDLRNLEDVRNRTSTIFSTSCGSGLATCFCTCCVSFPATSWKAFTFSVTGCSSDSWLRVQRLIGWIKTRSCGKHQASFPMRDHLRSRPQSSCHPCLRGRRHRARPNAGRGIQILSPCDIRLLPREPFWVRVDGSNRTQTRRQASIFTVAPCCWMLMYRRCNDLRRKVL